MGTILKGATVVELEPATVERVDLRVEEGQIVARGNALVPLEGDEVLDLRGKVVMPGLVCVHHHLYSSLARGMPSPQPPPTHFTEVLEKVWWRLDRALDLDAVEVSAAVGALDALSCGTTTVFDHHSSPRAIAGSLVRVARGLNQVGLRGVLCYEVTDRNGALGREDGIEENLTFHQKARGRFRGMLGAHASFTLSRDALEGLAEASTRSGMGVHLHLAEDPADEKISFARYGEVPMARLLNAGLLTSRSVVAHAVHLSWPELSTLIGTGAWLVHNPRSNMNNQVGYAPAGKFGARASFGTDGIGADLFAEAQLAHFRAQEAGNPLDALRWLANGHRLASDCFGMSIGPMQPGSVADLVVLDYRSPTPLNAENLASHFLFGFGAGRVEAVMVDGLWRLWARRPLSVDPEALAIQARQTTEALWGRLF